MIPRGVIYSHLRSRMIAAFPDGVLAPYGTNTTFGDWLLKGSIIVTATEKRNASFEAPQVEFSSILLVEIEHLLNHCFEHMQELACYSLDDRVRSAAWNVTTAYYLAFFSCSALLRLLGLPVVFLNRDQLSSLPKYLGSGHAPSQGSFDITQTASISATHATYQMKSSSKLHEATWLRLLGLLNDVRTQLRTTTDGNEALFYEHLCSPILFPQYVNYQWPSSVRIRANYRPGFAYKLERSHSSNSKIIPKWATMGEHGSSKLVSDAVTACRSDNTQFMNHVHFMTALGISLFLLARELYSELLIRKSIDKRWENRRREYRKHMIISKEENVCFAQTF
jgi:hypothetical protein